jgi:hypothetical protein
MEEGRAAALPIWETQLPISPPVTWNAGCLASIYLLRTHSFDPGSSRFPRVTVK